MGKKTKDPLGLFSSDDVMVEENDPLGILKKKEKSTPSASLEGSGTHGTTGELEGVHPAIENRVPNVSPAVANAFDVSRKGKEYQQLVKSAKANIQRKLDEHIRKTVAEKQASIKTQEEAEQANRLLRDELKLIHENEVAKANEEIVPKYKEFREAFNSPFKNKEYAKGFRETYFHDRTTPEELEKVMPGLGTVKALGESLGKGIHTAFFDLIPAGAASALAGTTISNFDNYLVAQKSTFNPNDYWNPELAFEKRKKEVIEDYIKENGVKKYEEEKAKFETERGKEKEGLLDYAKRQEGESTGKTSGIPETIGDIKNPLQATQYIGKNIGQTLGFMAPMVAASAINPALGATVGMGINSTVEKGEAYREGLDLIEQKTGIPRTELFKADADKVLMESSTRSGLINGMLEYLGAITTVGKFLPKNYVAQTLDKMLKNTTSKISVGAATEGLTEWAQAKDTHYAAALGAGASPHLATEYAMHQDDSEDFFAGVTGGLGIAGAAHVINPHQGLIDKTKEEVERTHGELETPLLDNLKGIDLKYEKPSAPSVETAVQNIPETGQEKNIQVQAEQGKQKEKINAFAERIKKGEKLESPEDLQFYENNKGEIENELKSSSIQKEVPTINGKQKLFVYGTLKDEKNREAVGLPKEVQPTIAPNEEKEDIKLFPEVEHDEGMNLKGDVIEVTPEELEKAKEWEKENYELSTIKLEDGSNAIVFKLKKNAPLTLKPKENASSIKSSVEMGEQSIGTRSSRGSGSEGVGSSLEGTQITRENQQQESQAQKEEGERISGVKRTLFNRAYEGATDEQIKLAIEKHGLEYAPETHLESTKKAEDFIKEVGLKNAVVAVQNNEINDASSALIYSRAIDSLNDDPQAQAELISEFDKKARTSGQFISALNEVYKNSDFNYSLQRQLNEYEKSGGQITEEIKNRFAELDRQLQEANKKINELETRKTKVTQEKEKKERIKFITEDKKKKINTFFDSLKVDTKSTGSLHSSVIPGLTLAPYVWNGSIEAIKHAVLTGVDIANAIQAGIDYIKEHHKEQFDEQKYRDHFTPLIQGVLPNKKLEANKKLVGKKISEYEKRLQEKDFSKKEKTPLPEDKELMDLKIKKNQIKEKFDIEQEKNRLRNRAFREKAWDVAMDAVNVPKSLLASIDMSAPFRQGIILSAGNPRAAGRAFSEMFAQAFSEDKAAEWLGRLKMTPEYQEMDASGLYIAEPNTKLIAKEEQFLSNFADKIPVIGRLVKASNRAYAGYLNKLRADVFVWGTNNLKDQGIEFKDNPEAYKQWASFVNNATGRGNLGALENSAPILNAVFFSPRFVASRINLLNPVTYAKMPSPVRRMATRNMLSYFAFFALVAAMMKSAFPDDVEIGFDPLSPDFMKLKIGNTRYDLGGGFLQVVRFLAQTTALAYSQLTMNERQYRKKYHEKTAADVILHFGRSKLSPTFGVAADVLTGKDFIGQPITLKGELMKSTMPLYLQDIRTIYQQDGSTGVLASGVPAFFGVGVQNYQAKIRK